MNKHNDTYWFAQNINGSNLNGIIAVHENKVMCYCTKQQAADILPLMNAPVNGSPDKEVMSALQPFVKLAESVIANTPETKNGPLYQFNAAQITYENLREVIRINKKYNKP